MNNAAVILCGGKSSRMKSPKALLPFGENILLKYQTARFAAVFDRIYISVSAQVRAMLDEKDFPDCVFVEDLEEAIGPMGGIYSCFKETGEDLLFFASVDSPFTDVNLAAALCEALRQNPDCNACSICDPAGRVQPLFCAYSCRMLPLLESSIAAGNYRIRSLINEKTLLIEDRILPEEQFFNMNDARSYYYALKRLACRQPGRFPYRFAQQTSGRRPYVLAVSGKSGTGKTTYLEKLIAFLRAEGVRVCAIKHDAHGIEIDRPGKDSYRLREAGAAQVILASKDLTFSVQTHPNETPLLEDLVSDVQDVDLILAEGYKYEKMPRLYLLRKGYAEAPVGRCEDIIAYAADFPYESDLKVYDLNRPEEFAEFLMKQLQITGRAYSKQEDPHNIS